MCGHMPFEDGLLFLRFLRFLFLLFLRFFFRFLLGGVTLIEIRSQHASDKIPHKAKSMNTIIAMD
jgi:hypothetical protein